MVEKKASPGSSTKYGGEWREVISDERIAAGMAFLRGASQEVQRDPGEMVERMASEIDYLRDQLDQQREANRENRRLLPRPWSVSPS